MKFFILATTTCVFSQSTNHCFAQCSSVDVACLSECFNMVSPADLLAGPTAECSPRCSSNATDTSMCPQDCLKEPHPIGSNSTASNSTHSANSTTKAAIPTKSANLAESTSVAAASNAPQSPATNPSSKPSNAPQSKVEASTSGAFLSSYIPAFATFLALLAFA
ncbi:hypothetical protein DSO57_1008834 [Entomophthora muscae]|uniref:Uncharacterized protein n=1 Tax=Entomophthora muscae TaxID=34485 RepID=A0ACC2RLV1_9FUNG|nr:hypothetical protein DSO57_1008834 [Entomophthora muscae]